MSPRPFAVSRCMASSIVQFTPELFSKLYLMLPLFDVAARRDLADTLGDLHMRRGPQ